MGDLFQELRRRNMFRIAGVYAVVGWLLIQIGVAVLPTFEAPPWVLKVFIALILGGFPVALILAWAFEMTLEGVKLTAKAPEGASPTVKTGRKLDYVIIGGLALVGAAIIADRTMPEKTDVAATNATALEAAPSEPKVSPASIAVLPFVDLSPSGDQGFFSDGISEEILNVLAKIDALKVASRTSAFVFKNTDLRIPEIAGELGVRHVLEGSVRRAGTTIRITAQLIDAQTDEHLWSDTFDRTLTAENVFAIQDEIANAIVNALYARMDLPDLRQPVTVTADTTDLTTLELYYEANARFLQRGRENLTRALALFEDITEREPGFARGWAGLANVATVAEGWGLEPRDYGTMTRQAAERAIALEPTLSSPYAALAVLALDSGDQNYLQILNNYKIALSLNPDDPNVYNWRAHFWVQTGFTERALDDANKCLELDPAYINCGISKTDLLFSLGRAEEADALSLELMRKGATVQLLLPPVMNRLAKNGRNFELLTAINIMVLEGYPGENWMVEPLYRGFRGLDDDRAAAFDRFQKRFEAAGYRPAATGTYIMILAAFRVYDRQPSWWLASWAPDLPGLDREMNRQSIEANGLPNFWRAYEFPPSCRPVGDDDYACDWAK